MSKIIFDINDDLEFEVGEIKVGNIDSPATQAPISPPRNVSISNNTINWETNPENDLKGYRIHYGNFDGISFEYTIDVGMVNSFSINQINASSDIYGVTSYDTNFTAAYDDQCKGHESWYTVVTK